MYLDFLNACSSGNFELVKTLSSQHQDWSTGMLYACEGGHENIVKLMIEKGADEWNFGMLYACKGGHLDIVKFMIECCEKKDRFFIIAVR